MYFLCLEVWPICLFRNVFVPRPEMSVVLLWSQTLDNYQNISSLCYISVQRRFNMAMYRRKCVAVTLTTAPFYIITIEHMRPDKVSHNIQNILQLVFFYDHFAVNTIPIQTKRSLRRQKQYDGYKVSNSAVIFAVFIEQ